MILDRQRPDQTRAAHPAAPARRLCAVYCITIKLSSAITYVRMASVVACCVLSMLADARFCRGAAAADRCLEIANVTAIDGNDSLTGRSCWLRAGVLPGSNSSRSKGQLLGQEEGCPHVREDHGGIIVITRSFRSNQRARIILLSVEFSSETETRFLQRNAE